MSVDCYYKHMGAVRRRKGYVLCSSIIMCVIKNTAVCHLTAWFCNFCSCIGTMPTKTGESSVECYGHAFLIGSPLIRTLW